MAAENATAADSAAKRLRHCIALLRSCASVDTSAEIVQLVGSKSGANNAPPTTTRLGDTLFSIANERLHECRGNLDVRILQEILNQSTIRAFEGRVHGDIQVHSETTTATTLKSKTTQNGSSTTEDVNNTGNTVVKAEFTNVTASASSTLASRKIGLLGWLEVVGDGSSSIVFHDGQSRIPIVTGARNVHPQCLFSLVFLRTWAIIPPSSFSSSSSHSGPVVVNATYSLEIDNVELILSMLDVAACEQKGQLLRGGASAENNMKQLLGTSAPQSSGINSSTSVYSSHSSPVPFPIAIPSNNRYLLSGKAVAVSSLFMVGNGSSKAFLLEIETSSSSCASSSSGGRKDSERTSNELILFEGPAFAWLHQLLVPGVRYTISMLTRRTVDLLTPSSYSTGAGSSTSATSTSTLTRQVSMFIATSQYNITTVSSNGSSGTLPASPLLYSLSTFSSSSSAAAIAAMAGGAAPGATPAVTIPSISARIARLASQVIMADTNRSFLDIYMNCVARQEVYAPSRTSPSTIDKHTNNNNPMVSLQGRVIRVFSPSQDEPTKHTTCLELELVTSPSSSGRNVNQVPPRAYICLRGGNSGNTVESSSNSSRSSHGWTGPYLVHAPRTSTLRIPGSCREGAIICIYNVLPVVSVSTATAAYGHLSSSPTFRRCYTVCSRSSIHVLQLSLFSSLAYSPSQIAISKESGRISAISTADVSHPHLSNIPTSLGAVDSLSYSPFTSVSLASHLILRRNAALLAVCWFQRDKTVSPPTSILTSTSSLIPRTFHQTIRPTMITTSHSTIATATLLSKPWQSVFRQFMLVWHERMSQQNTTISSISSFSSSTHSATSPQPTHPVLAFLSPLPTAHSPASFSLPPLIITPTQLMTMAITASRAAVPAMRKILQNPTSSPFHWHFEADTVARERLLHTANTSIAETITTALKHSNVNKMKTTSHHKTLQEEGVKAVFGHDALSIRIPYSLLVNLSTAGECLVEHPPPNQLSSGQQQQQETPSSSFLAQTNPCWLCGDIVKQGAIWKGPEIQDSNASIPLQMNLDIHTLESHNDSTSYTSLSPSRTRFFNNSFSLCIEIIRLPAPTSSSPSANTVPSTNLFSESNDHTSASDTSLYMFARDVPIRGVDIPSSGGGNRNNTNEAHEESSGVFSNPFDNAFNLLRGFNNNSPCDGGWKDIYSDSGQEDTHYPKELFGKRKVTARYRFRTFITSDDNNNKPITPDMGTENHQLTAVENSTHTRQQPAYGTLQSSLPQGQEGHIFASGHAAPILPSFIFVPTAPPRFKIVRSMEEDNDTAKKDEDNGGNSDNHAEEEELCAIVEGLLARTDDESMGTTTSTASIPEPFRSSSLFHRRQASDLEPTLPSIMTFSIIGIVKKPKSPMNTSYTGAGSSSNDNTSHKSHNMRNNTHVSSSNSASSSARALLRQRGQQQYQKPLQQQSQYYQPQQLHDWEDEENISEYDASSVTAASAFLSTPTSSSSSSSSSFWPSLILPSTDISLPTTTSCFSPPGLWSLSIGHPSLIYGEDAYLTQESITTPTVTKNNNNNNNAVKGPFHAKQISSAFRNNKNRSWSLVNVSHIAPASLQKSSTSHSSSLPASIELLAQKLVATALQSLAPSFTLRTALTVRASLHGMGELFTGEEPSQFWQQKSLVDTAAVTGINEGVKSTEVEADAKAEQVIEATISSQTTQAVVSAPPSFSLLGKIISISCEPPDDRYIRSNNNSNTNEDLHCHQSSLNCSKAYSGWIGYGQADVKVSITLAHVSLLQQQEQHHQHTKDETKWALHDTITVFFRPQFQTGGGGGDGNAAGLVLPFGFAPGATVLFTSVQRSYSKAGHKLFCKCDSGATFVILPAFSSSESSLPSEFEDIANVYAIIDPAFEDDDDEVEEEQKQEQEAVPSATQQNSSSIVLVSPPSVRLHPLIPLWSLVSDDSTNRVTIRVISKIQRLLWTSIRWFCGASGDALIPVSRYAVLVVEKEGNLRIPPSSSKEEYANEETLSSFSSQPEPLEIYVLYDHLMIKKRDAHRVSIPDATNHSFLNSSGGGSSGYQLPRVLLSTKTTDGSSSGYNNSNRSSSKDMKGGQGSSSSAFVVPSNLPLYDILIRKTIPLHVLPTAIRDGFKIVTNGTSAFSAGSSIPSPSGIVCKLEASVMLEDGTGGEVKAHCCDVYIEEHVGSTSIVNKSNLHESTSRYLPCRPPDLGATAKLLNLTCRQLQHFQCAAAAFGQLEINTRFATAANGASSNAANDDDTLYSAGPSFGSVRLPNPSMMLMNKATSAVSGSSGSGSLNVPAPYHPLTDSGTADEAYWRRIAQESNHHRNQRIKLGHDNDVHADSYDDDKNDVQLPLDDSDAEAEEADEAVLQQYGRELEIDTVYYQRSQARQLKRERVEFQKYVRSRIGKRMHRILDATSGGSASSTNSDDEREEVVEEKSLMRGGGGKASVKIPMTSTFSSSITPDRSSSSIYDHLPSHVRVNNAVYADAVAAAAALRACASRNDDQITNWDIICQPFYPAEFQVRQNNTTANTTNNRDGASSSNAEAGGGPSSSKLSREMQWRRDASIRLYAPPVAELLLAAAVPPATSLQIYGTNSSSSRNSISTGKTSHVSSNRAGERGAVQAYSHSHSSSSLQNIPPLPTVLVPCAPVSTRPIPPPSNTTRRIRLGADDYESRALPKIHVRVLDAQRVQK